MRFLILSTDYHEFLRWLFAQHPEFEKQSYEAQMRVRNESLFGVADFYSSNLRWLGHQANSIFANNELMQRTWALEHGIPIRAHRPLEKRLRTVLPHSHTTVTEPLLRVLRLSLQSMVAFVHRRPSWFYDFLAAQIKHYRPDVLVNQAMDSIGSRFLRTMKPYVGLLVGQIASPLPQDGGFRCYDLVISSLPNVVRHFRGIGVPAELHRLAFEPQVLSRLDNDEESIPVSFVGNLSTGHEDRLHLLEYLCRRLGVEIWTPNVGGLPRESAIWGQHKGSAWGIGMYRILRRSKITVNHHIDMAESFANNCRLYEATGVGTMLVTDWKTNLHEMFEPGREVVAYRSPEECVKLIRYYLEHDNEREAIARAGQRRTLSEHTYYHRVQDLLDIIQKYL